MLQDELNNKYFNWLYDLVHGNNQYNKLSYRTLLLHLYYTEFTYLHYLDENRAIDGVDFRYRFAWENGYDRETIKEYLDVRPCSVLEMMVALAFRAEEDIMDDNNYGNRTGQWFWNMIVTLGLGSMSDEHFDIEYVDYVLYRFLNRQYERNGKGGLFIIEDCGVDVREMEIWTQFMWYLDEFIENQ